MESVIHVGISLQLFERRQHICTEVVLYYCLTQRQTLVFLHCLLQLCLVNVILAICHLLCWIYHESFVLLVDLILSCAWRHRVRWYIKQICQIGSTCYAYFKENKPAIWFFFPVFTYESKVIFLVMYESKLLNRQGSHIFQHKLLKLDMSKHFWAKSLVSNVVKSKDS